MYSRASRPDRHPARPSRPRPFRRTVLLVAVALLAVTALSEASGPPPNSGRSSREIADDEMAKMRAARWAAADYQLVVAPWLPSLPGHSTRLVVNSRLTEPLVLEIEATGADGAIHPLTVETLEPRSTLRLDVDSLLELADPGQGDHSLRLSYFGDAEMIQAWVVTDGPGGVMEMPMIKVSTQPVGEWVSFWDTAPYARGNALRPRFAFHNTRPTPVGVTLRVTGPAGSPRTVELSLSADGTAYFSPRPTERVAGLWAQHDGAPGQVQASAVLSGPAFLTRLPLVTAGALADAETFESMSLVTATAAGRRTILSLYNADAAGPAPVEVQLLEPATGAVLAAASLELAPGAPRSVDVLALLASAAPGSVGERFRLRVVPATAGVIAQAVDVGAAGRPTDVTLIPASKIHDSGTYPLPDLEGHEVVTELLNLGDEPAQIFAHLSWQGHDYAVEPFEVPAGGSYRIDFRQLAELGEADPAGRRFRPGDQPVYLQWMGRRGSSSLIARTQVRPEGDSDAFGFNCFGCCEEWPYGGMVPEFAAFLVGTSADFMAAEYIQTCSGTIGPFYANPATTTYTSPLSWNTQDVWASGQTEQTVSFTSSGSYMQVFCKPRPINFFGDGPTVADEICQQTHNPGFDPLRGCCGMFGSNVTACKACCDREKAVGDCRCNKLPLFRGICKGLVSLFSTLDCHGPCAVGCGEA